MNKFSWLENSSLFDALLAVESRLFKGVCSNMVRLKICSIS